MISSGYKRFLGIKNLLFRNTISISRSTNPAPARRATRRSKFCAGIDRVENRELLSGVAIYPQPAIVSTAVATPTASLADFTEGWNVTTSEGSLSAIATQVGNQVHVDLHFGLTIVGIDGEVKGQKAHFKISQNIEGYDVDGKIVAKMTTPTSIKGIAKGKVEGLGKMKIPFTGVPIL